MSLTHRLTRPCYGRVSRLGNPRVKLVDRSAQTIELDAPGSRKLPRLEALFAEHRTALRRLEGYRGLLAAVRAHRGRFHAFAPVTAAGRTAGPLPLAGFAPFRLVFEVLVGEELLFSRRPDELCAAVHAREDSVLELHRSYLVGVGLRTPPRASYSVSRRSFFRLRLRARACFARRLSPGFK